MDTSKKAPHVIVIGGGFTGLSAALDLTEAGLRVTVLERDNAVGGLAGTFDLDGYRLEKFYHHFFTNDVHIIEMIQKLGLHSNIIVRPTRTGTYYNKHFYRMSSPLDLLKFTPLSVIDRIRLGLLVFQVRKVKDWHQIEPLSVKEWLIGLSGKKVYEVVWEPLLIGKFGPYADDVSAVWFWKKLVLRGSSRGRTGAEMLAYYRGGFSALAESLAEGIRSKGGTIRTGVTVEGLMVEHNLVTGFKTSAGPVHADAGLVTTAFPVIADIIAPHVSSEYVTKLRRIRYLANICLVLELDRKLSDIYWLNVNDPDFPFIGIIEHTNFEPPDSYGGKHIVYLSKYLPKSDRMYRMTDREVYDFALPYLKGMFPSFDERWVKSFRIWRADYAQPIAEKNYSTILPENETPLSNFFISTMAQIYPEDRGINYAIREGKAIGRKVANIFTRDI